MSIRVRSVTLQAAPAEGAPAVTVPRDGYLDQIVKSIPSQVIAFYTAAITWLGGATGSTDSNPKLWIAFVLGLVLTWVLTWKQTHEPGKPPAYPQIALATVSFAVWAFAIPGPFTSFSFWSAGLAAVVLAAYTILLGAIPMPQE